MKNKDLGMLKLRVILAFKFVCKYIVEKSSRFNYA